MCAVRRRRLMLLLLLLMQHVCLVGGQLAVDVLLLELVLVQLLLLLVVLLLKVVLLLHERVALALKRVGGATPSLRTFQNGAQWHKTTRDSIFNVSRNTRILVLDRHGYEIHGHTNEWNMVS